MTDADERGSSDRAHRDNPRPGERSASNGAAGGSGRSEAESSPDHREEPIQPIRRTQHKGVAALIAAGMLGLDEALGRKPREEAPIVVDANGEPVDIDSDGIEVRVADAGGGEVAVAAPALPRSAPLPSAKSSAARRRARGA